MNTLFVVYITTPHQEAAQNIAAHLLEKKIIACANVFPINSIYWWNNAVEKNNEAVLLVKTLPQLFGTIKKEVAILHPYETPCVAGFPAEVNDEYFKYMNEVIEMHP